MPRLLTIVEAADWMRMSAVEVGRRCTSGQLKATKPGRTWLIDPDDIRAYLAAHSNQPRSEQTEVSA